MSTSEQSSTAQLRRLIMGYRLTQAIAVAAKLRLADLLKDEPRSVKDLAAMTKTQPQPLYRVLRLLASEGIFTEQEPGIFAITPLAEPLQSDVPNSLRARAVFDGEALNWHAWGNLLHSVQTGEVAFQHTFGASFFDYVRKHPEAAASFDEHMARQTAMTTRAVVEAYDFSRMRTVVDVGGGYGALLSAVLAANPAAHGILFDLPHVVAGAQPWLEAANVADRCEVVGGSFFDGVPEGGDCYIIKFILHNWNDEQCRTILRNCRRSIAPNGRLVVVEALMQPGNAPDYTKYLDVNMLIHTSGWERTQQEFQEMFEATGFRLNRVISTPSELSLIEGVPA